MAKNETPFYGKSGQIGGVAFSGNLVATVVLTGSAEDSKVKGLTFNAHIKNTGGVGTTGRVDISVIYNNGSDITIFSKTKEVTLGADGFYDFSVDILEELCSSPTYKGFVLPAGHTIKVLGNTSGISVTAVGSFGAMADNF